MKLLRRPVFAAALAVVVDILMLVAAVVLDALRARFGAEYSFNSETLEVTAQHPYDYFGIVAALALVFVTVMAAFVIAGGFASGGGKVAQRVCGGIALVVVSAAVVLFSFLVVRGKQPDRIEFIAYTDDTLHLVIAEERYADDLGAAKIYGVDVDSGEARLLVSTDISTFADGNTERYEFVWADAQTLAIGFMDGMTKRVLQFDPYK